MIVVTGATGQLGRLIVEKLLDRLPADQVGASVRDPAKATDLQARGVRVRRGDFAESDTLRDAFEGADQLLIVSSNAAAYRGDPRTQHRAAIDAARAAGVRRIVYTSHMAASPSSAFAPMHDHAATEGMLRESGLAWAALRNGFYASSGIFQMGDALKTGVIAAPADGRVSWTAHPDLAEAAAIVLANEGRYDGPTPPLTGSQALDLADLAHVASDVLGRPVTRQVLTEDAFRTDMQTRGMPAAFAEFTLGLYRASRAGEFSSVDPTLAQLLRRDPITMRKIIAETAKS